MGDNRLCMDSVRHAAALACSVAALAAAGAGCEVVVSAGSVTLPPSSRDREPVRPLREVTAPGAAPGIATDQVFVRDLAAGASHVCARTVEGFAPVEGRVRCWGSNARGQLGRGTLGGFSPEPSLAGRGVLARQIFAGPNQTAVLDSDGAFGHRGLHAPLGDDVTPWSKHDTPGVGPLAGVAFGGRFAVAWDEGGRLIGWGEPGGASFTTAFLIKPVLIHLGFGVRQASVWSRSANGHGCFVMRNDFAACWGNNDAEQLGRTPFELGIFHVPLIAHVVRVSVGDGFSCALRDDATAWCWGDNRAGQLGDGTGIGTGLPARVNVSAQVFALTTGRQHACALARNGTVWCWGSNASGQLGTPAVESLSTVPVLVVGLPKATDVVAGDDFTCARTEDGHAYCWGDNDMGQLGDGTTVRRAEPRPVVL